MMLPKRVMFFWIKKCILNYGTNHIDDLWLPKYCNLIYFLYNPTYWFYSLNLIIV